MNVPVMVLAGGQGVRHRRPLPRFRTDHDATADHACQSARQGGLVVVPKGV